jgi:hypothetical protein
MTHLLLALDLLNVGSREEEAWLTVSGEDKFLSFFILLFCLL